MRITVIGGNSGTGAEMVRRAAERGHDVTCFSLAAPLADHNDQEAAVFASGLDWTVVRPGGLNDKPATGAVVAQETAEGRAMKAMIPRADVAEYIVSILDDATTHGKALGLGTG